MQRKFAVGIPIIAILFVALAVLSGGFGIDGVRVAFAEGETPPTGMQPESCTTCHSDAGNKHQVAYDQLYQDGVLRVSDLTYSFTAPDTSIVSFKMMLDGAPFDARKADALNIYFTPYADSKFQFDPPAERMSLKGKLSYDGAGGITSEMTGTTDLSAVDGLLVVFGRDETLGTIPGTRVTQNKYPFAAILKTGKGVDYVSAANNAGCQSCHTTPYLKHGYIYAEINHDPSTDFYTCKACHQDNGKGGHFEWQLLVDDPALAASYLAQETKLTEEQQTKYAYKTSLMNDVHMSHAMEFPYPQSMANCATCHEGKLDKILADANFTAETCKSCHPISGSEKAGTKATSIEKMLASSSDHKGLDLNKDSCTACHKAGDEGPTLKEIHSGYNKVIYTSDGLKYSKVISVTIDKATFDGSKLDFSFSANQSTAIPGVDPTTIRPTVMVGLYGYDTKDFIIGPHERLKDDSGDGAIDSKDARALEYVVGAKHPRFTTVSAKDGKWEVVADLSDWTNLITDGTVKRVEIGVMPLLMDSKAITLALNAPSRTFDLGKNAFADDFYAPIAKVVDGCNNCHDALATTFHTPDRGGNITVCRMCHITKSGGSHLEMQSRSIDSYIHAIHSFQAFDIANIDFSDPVQKMKYQHHTETTYPSHGANCESCHLTGTYNVPDQSKSLPAILSASAELKGWDRHIGTVASYVTGPASKACGGCHRAELINEDNANGLISFNQHTKQGGYMIEAGKDPISTLNEAINWIMALFK